jgi:hypothetical protein
MNLCLARKIEAEDLLVLSFEAALSYEGCFGTIESSGIDIPGVAELLNVVDIDRLVGLFHGD